MIHAAILCRVSTEGQRDNTSLAEQRRLLIDLCERNGWTWEAFEEVESGGAGIANRPILAQIMGRITAGEFSRLVVLVQDRLSRAGVGELEHISATLARVGARLVTQSGEFDPRNADHAFITDINAVLAKRERAAIRERMIRGSEAKAREGARLGHPIPYGYRVVYDPDGTARVEVVTPEADCIRRAFALYVEDTMGYVLIADQMRAEGFAWRNGESLDWQRVYRIIRNCLYAGIQERRKSYTRDSHKTDLPSFSVPSKAWPAIVSPELWERCRAIRESRSQPETRRSIRDWPLSGILRCPSCGSSMMSAMGRDKKRDGSIVYYHYYRCTLKIKRLGTCEDPLNVRADQAHASVLALTGRVMAWLAKGTIPVEPEPEMAAELQRLDARLRELDDEEKDLWQQKRTGKINQGQWERFNARLLDARGEAEAAIAGLRRKVVRVAPEIPNVEAILADPRIVDDFNALRSIFASVFHRLVIVRYKRHYNVTGPVLGRPKDWVKVQSATLINGQKWPPSKRKGPNKELSDS